MNLLQTRVALSFCLFVVAGSAFAYDASYVSTAQVDFAKLLPPPPLPDSVQQKSDLEAVLRAQADRTAQQAERAVKDNAPSGFQIENGILGSGFSETSLPKFMA